MKKSFDGIFIVSTNPLDIITHVTWSFSGLPKNKIIGTGTLLDTARYTHLLGEYFNVDPRNVSACILERHGDSQVAAYGSSTIGGRLITDIVQSNKKYSMKGLNKIAIEVLDVADLVIEQKGSTYKGIGEGLARLTKSILKNEHTTLPVSAYLEDEYDYSGFFTGVPAIFNRDGIQEVIDIKLAADEKKKFDVSVKVITDTIKILNF